MSAIRFGVIGCGTMGTALATQVGKAGPPAVVSAVCDILPDPRERLSDDLGCDAVASAPELRARDRLGAVIVATPNHLHREDVLAVVNVADIVEGPELERLMLATASTRRDAVIAAAARAIASRGFSDSQTAHETMGRSFDHMPISASTQTPA